MFSYFTGDWTYLHSDREAAGKSAFGERIAHGYMTLSVSLGLMVRSGVIDPAVFRALKSIEYVRFIGPVKIGDTLTVFYSSKREASRRGTVCVKTDAHTINQRNETVMEFGTTHLEKAPAEIR